MAYLVFHIYIEVIVGWLEWGDLVVRWLVMDLVETVRRQSQGVDASDARVAERRDASSDETVSDSDSWAQDLGDRGDDFGRDRLLVDDGVEALDGVGGVLDDTTGAIGLDQGVRSLDDVSRAGLLLVLHVTGQRILNGSRRGASVKTNSLLAPSAEIFPRTLTAMS